VEYTKKYLEQTIQIASMIDQNEIIKAVNLLKETRKIGGRLFILGVGGSASNASHAVNDFRKIAGIEAYAPTDNVSELTARTNDQGWQHVFSHWLRTSKINSKDLVMVFSVGGGNAEKNISANLVEAMKVAKEAEAKIIGMVSRDGGYTKQVSDSCILIPTIHNSTITPHAESFQGVIWHLLVSHPEIQINEMKWESVNKN
jgi:D-sedoheptulose 7-phosphate isomerase